MSLAELDKQTRKNFYKLLDKETLGRSFRTCRISPQMFIKETRTTFDRIEKGRLDAAADELIVLKGNGNAIAMAYSVAVKGAIIAKVPSMEPEAENLIEKEYDALSEEDWKRLDEHRQEFENSDLSSTFTYEDIVQVFCSRNQQQKKESELNRIEELEKKIRELEADKNKLQEDLEKERKQYSSSSNQSAQKEKNLNEKISSLQKKLDEYESIFAEKNLSVSLEKILGRPVKGNTCRQLYDALSGLEKELLSSDENDEKLEEVLAAKYTILQLKENAHA